jgi:hypothetical protein
MFPSIAVISRKTISLAKRLVQPFSKRNLLEATHVMGPTLTALALMGAGSAVAHAQGTMDFSGAQTLMSTFKTFAMYAGAVICLGGLIFAGIRMMSGRFQDAIRVFSARCSAPEFWDGEPVGYPASQARECEARPWSGEENRYRSIRR